MALTALDWLKSFPRDEEELMRGRQPSIAILTVSLLLAVGAAACTGGAATQPSPGPAPDQTSPSAQAGTIASEETGGEGVADTAPKFPVPPVVGRTGDEELAPDLTGITGWINSEPFTLESQRGRVVLVDFWTYTCINCIRTFPYLRAWHEKYAGKGLVILGVHSPEFDFEKLRENVVDAMERHGIEYAVAQDNDFGTFHAFGNRTWPAKYLIDQDGYIRYTHFGEGDYDETEQKVRELLAETGADLTSISPQTEPGPEISPAALGGNPGERWTRELYAGWGRNYAAVFYRDRPYVLHEEFYVETDADILYKDPGKHQNDYLYLNGLWRNREESLVHARETENYEDYIAIKFYATSVNAVMAPENPGKLRVRVRLNGVPLMPALAGADVMFDADGDSYILVDEARMYRVVDMPTFGGHELTLSSNSSEFELFAFTFGGYKGGEPDS